MVKYFFKICFANLQYNDILSNQNKVFFRKGRFLMCAKKKMERPAFEELTLLNRNHTEYPDAPDKAKKRSIGI